MEDMGRCGCPCGAHASAFDLSSEFSNAQHTDWCAHHPEFFNPTAFVALLVVMAFIIHDHPYMLRYILLR